MEAATQLGCWSWPTLDPATLAAQFGTTQCFQGPPPSMPVTSKKDIKVESPEAALPEQDTEEMHLRSKRLSARSASAINISMSSASSPKTNKRSRDSDEEYEDYDEGSSSPKMGGKGKKTRDSYACLRHRAMHKRCPLDCADRRIPRPLPVATERKQIQELNQLRGVKLKSLSKLAKTTTIAAVAAALQKCKTPEEMELCLAELPSSIPSSPTTPCSSQPQSRSTTPPPSRGRKPKDKQLSSSTSCIFPTGPMNLRNRQKDPPAASNLSGLNLAIPQNAAQETPQIGMTTHSLSLNNVQYIGGIQPVPFGSDAWPYGGGGWEACSDINQGTNKFIWDDLVSSVTWEESKLTSSGSNVASSNAAPSTALDEILDFNCLNNEEEGSLSFDESDLFDSTNTNIYFNSELPGTNGGSIEANPLNLVGDTDDLFASGSVSSKFQQINLASPSTPDLSASGSSNLTSPATDSLVFGRPEEISHNNGDLQHKEFLPRYFLTRDILEKWINDPYFSKLVSGFFVQISLGPGDERMAQIVEARDLCYSSQATVTTSKALLVQYIGTDIRNMVMLPSVLNTLPSEQQMLRCLEQLKSVPLHAFEMEQKLNIINQRPRVQ